MSSMLFKDRDRPKSQQRNSTSILTRFPEEVNELVTEIEQTHIDLTPDIDLMMKPDSLVDCTNKMNSFCYSLLKLMQVEQLYLFDEVSNLAAVLLHKGEVIKFARILCNEMENSHFKLLQVMTYKLAAIPDSRFCIEFIYRLVSLDSNDKYVQLAAFFHILVQNPDAVFKLDSVEPFYVESPPSREITAASVNTMFDLIFEDSFHEPNYMRNFIYFIPFFLKHREAYEMMISYYNAFCEDNPTDPEMQAFVSWKFVRIERLVLSWLDIMSTMIMEVEPGFFKELGKTPLLESQKLTDIFKNKFRTFLKIVDKSSTEEVEAVPFMQTQARDILFSIVSTEYDDQQQIMILLQSFTIEPYYSMDLKSKTVNLIQLQPEFLAEQLILFDLKEFQKVHAHDFYLSRKDSTLNGYTLACQKIEYWAMRAMGILRKHKLCEYFIKVAKFCLDKKGYNMAYLLYSTLTQQTIKRPDVWSKVKKSRLQTFQKLEVVFDIRSNYKNYRTTCDLDNGIPIMMIWMHDIVNINCIPTKYESTDFYNFSKLRAIGSSVAALRNAQRVEFQFKPHPTVMKILDNIIVPELK
ncbi:hypothetical protein EIN_033940 [Entamoeba invadens IP1]|uniref:Ras-GEF domain-containing protein n=1 Tax=Entamoeba invadens IP1 TaxID=370355 RepID=A0A0A1U1L2_ENTIV|nr:hypothetical protein EIN_033940 [Entamoeba invadens IP1]ELP86493.1 hypothetical protein EIN_033940 [Entamoeba invadens IP1]|eukprot:XP_004185839.1 hypothetical protein EIN_033940 [Entamoeba invadens IP1]